METETARQVKALWKKVDNVENDAREALILAKHADKGYIEAYSDLKNLKEAQGKMKTTLEVVKVEVEDLDKSFTTKLSSNLKWTLGFMATLITAYTGLLLFIISQMMK